MGRILRHINPLLSNYRETDNKKAAVARQRPMSSNRSIIGSGAFYVVCSEAVSRHRHNSVLLESIPCGGVVEYFHRSPASRRRRRKWNPVPGGITGPPCSWGCKYGDIALQVGESRIWDSKIWSESDGTLTWEWLRWQRPATTVHYRPIFSSETMLYKDYNHKSSVEKTNNGRGLSRGLVPRETIWRLSVSRKLSLNMIVQLVSTAEWSKLVGVQSEDCVSVLVIRCPWKLVAEVRGEFNIKEQGKCPLLVTVTRQRLAYI
jgi:hypothetical protein